MHGSKERAACRISFDSKASPLSICLSFRPIVYAFGCSTDNRPVIFFCDDDSGENFAIFCS